MDSAGLSDARHLALLQLVSSRFDQLSEVLGEFRVRNLRLDQLKLRVHFCLRHTCMDALCTLAVITYTTRDPQ